ncbi:ATP-binding cassette domain-containing protein [bacterium]|nr:ATP-binding cassette domain-containing protein [bacterium]
MKDDKPLVECRALVKGYGRNCARAVDRVDLSLAPGETLALVGESGCGKSTTGRLLLALERPDSGSVSFDGVELSALGAGPLRRLRKRMQMVFQDPLGSLNPRFTVFRTLAEPLRLHAGLDGGPLRARVEELLRCVGLDAAHAGRFPHEFSGGQRQRVAIARAIAAGPDFVVADEPVSALDLSIQGQILTLLLQLKRSLGLTLLFISHDLGVVRAISDRVAVMRRGRVVELADTAELFGCPLHPYTRTLLACAGLDGGLGGGGGRGGAPDGCAWSDDSQFDSAAVVPDLVEHSTGHWVALKK